MFSGTFFYALAFWYRTEQRWKNYPAACNRKRNVLFWPPFWIQIFPLRPLVFYGRVMTGIVGDEQSPREIIVFQGRNSAFLSQLSIQEKYRSCFPPSLFKRQKSCAAESRGIIRDNTGSDTGKISALAGPEIK